MYSFKLSCHAYLLHCFQSNYHGIIQGSVDNIINTKMQPNSCVNGMPQQAYISQMKKLTQTIIVCPELHHNLP